MNIRLLREAQAMTDTKLREEEEAESGKSILQLQSSWETPSVVDREVRVKAKQIQVSLRDCDKETILSLKRKMGWCSTFPVSS